MILNGAPAVITIDGPTASGKGSLARGVARRLGFHILDSGAIYRAFALFAESQDLDPSRARSDPGLAQEKALQLPLAFLADRVLLDGVDVSDAIRAERIGNLASEFSALPAVRSALLERQRAFLREPGLVADGRDMGTVVFPDARLKVFLVAALEARALRRTKELIEKGFSVTLAEVSADLEKRDARDRTRSVAPLGAARGAYVLDGTALSLEASVEQVLKWWYAIVAPQEGRAVASSGQR